jgi:hypothetical protein
MQNEISSGQVTVGAFIKSGWEIFKKRPWFFIGVNFTFYGILVLAALLTGALQGIVTYLGHPTIAVFINQFISLGIQTFLGMGLIALYLKAHDSVETVQLKDLWHPQYFWKYLGTYILYMLAVMVGFLLLMVPGVIASLAFMFAIYIAVDKGLNPIEALKESARITKGNRLRILLFSFAVSLVCLAGFLALFVGIFVAIPVTMLAFINAYRRLNLAADTHVAPVRFTKGEKGLIIANIVMAVLMGILVVFIFNKLSSDEQFRNIFRGNHFPTGPGIHIEAGERQPANALAPLGANRLPFTVFSLVNNTNEPITIYGVDVLASELTDQQGIAKVSLIDESGVELGSAQPLNANRQAHIGGIFTIPALTSKMYLIAATAATCDHLCKDDGEFVSIGLTAVDTPSTVYGDLPIVGGQEVLNSHLLIGSIIATQENLGNSSTISGSGADVTFAKLHFVAGSTEDLSLNSVRFTYTGTVDPRNLTNLQVTVDGVDYPAMWSTDATNTVTAFTKDVSLGKNKSMNVSLHGSVATGAANGGTVEFDLDDASNAHFVGQTYGYAIEAAIGAQQSLTGVRGDFRANTIPWFKGPTFTVVK